MSYTTPETQEDPWENNPSGNLLKGIDIGRLHETVKMDRQALEPYLENLRSFAEQHAGSFYGPGGTNYEVYLPLISTFLSVHSRALVSKEPRVQFVTFDEKMLPAVDAMENWENDYFEEIELGDTLRRVVHDALMSEGRIKVCLTPPEVAESGYYGKVGQPNIYQIHEEDWVCDMRARDYKELRYCGHRYCIPLEVAQGIFRKSIQATDPSDTTHFGNHKLFTIGAGARSRRDEIEDYVDLWEIHIYRKGIVITILDDNGLPSASKKDVVRVKKYVGPRSGNITTLGYGTLSGNLRPISPVMGLMPVHLAANRNYRKIIETADDYKSVLPVKGGQMSEDGKTLKQSRHKEIIACDNAQELREARFNVPPPELLALSQDLRQAFDYIGGGLASLGGRAPSSPTATQEKIVAANANAGLSDMASTTVSFVGRTVKILNYYLWYHPENVYKTTKSIPGLPNEFIQRELYPSYPDMPSYEELKSQGKLMREGPMPRIRIDPFSLPHITPAERNQVITQILAELAPYAAIMAQQGYIPDFGEILELKAKLNDEPKLKKIYKFQGPPEPQQGMEGEEESAGGLNKEVSGKPAQTERTYNRVSTGGQGPQAQHSDMIRKLAQQQPTQ